VGEAAGVIQERAGVAVRWWLTCLLAIGCVAQTQSPRFDVAAIRLNTTAEGAGITFAARPGGRLSVINNELANVIGNAWNVERYRMTGGPGWIDSDRYDIDAKVDGSPSRPEMMAMLQVLLAERFKLRTHFESRQGPVYNLTVAKGGLKIRSRSDQNCVSFDPATPGPRPANTCGNDHISNSAWTASNIDMAGAVRALSVMMGRTVIDKTGYVGTFDVKIEWTADQSPFGASTASAGDATGPAFSTMLEEQLGLKLESARGPVEMLVIDHIERPSEN
jgi:uncharacterized protein (TIGR03435 family)